MITQHLLHDLGARGTGNARLHPFQEVSDRLCACLKSLEAARTDPSCPSRTSEKLTQFLHFMTEAHTKLGTRLEHPAYSINVVAEGMARADLIHSQLVDFLQVAIYFFGLDQIERRWPAHAIVYSGIHCDELSVFLSRSSLKALLAAGSMKLAQGKHFCLTYMYLNQLRRAYWKHCRASEDALDVAIGGSLVEAEAMVAETKVAPSTHWEPSERVQLLLRLFRSELSDTQRWIYLAKSHAGSDQLGRAWSSEGFSTDFGTVGGGDLNWTEIASRLGINEKTAKREYLKSLYVLLKGTAEAVLGEERMGRGYVRRVLTLIREIIAEKDLRIRNSNGRGLATLVEKWEVALRFVLNHERAEVA